jgi:hypothetical protein
MRIMIAIETQAQFLIMSFALLDLAMLVAQAGKLFLKCLVRFMSLQCFKNIVPYL